MRYLGLSTLAILLALSFVMVPSSVFVVADLTDALIIQVDVTKGKQAVYSRLHILASMPEGFEYISGVEAASGSATVRLSIKSLVDPWTTEYRENRRGALPLIMIVAVGEEYAGVGFVTLKEEEFTGPASKAVQIELSQKLPPLEEQTSGGQTLSSVLIDWHEWYYCIDIGELRTNQNAWGTIGGTYNINKKIGFTIDAFVSSWTIGSYFWVWKNEQSPLDEHVDVLESNIGYIWMKCKYRFEHWLIDGYISLYNVYIKDFYPSTVDATLVKKGSEAQIEEWVYDGTKTSTNPKETLFWRQRFSTSFRISSVDVLSYIAFLYALRKLPYNAYVAAASLLISVNFVYSTETAFAFTMHSHADAGTSHVLFYVRDYYSGVPYPAYYWWIWKVP